MIEKKDDLRRW